MNNRKVILARHGETELNRLGIVQGSGVDPALNEFGEQQSDALFQALEHKVDLVGSSGMLRAKQTAEPFVATGIPYFEDDRFREICWGEHEGKIAEPWMRADYQALMEAWDSGNLDASHRGGESALELASRLSAAWQSLIERHFSSALVITHGRALRCLVCLLEGKPLSYMNTFEHANGGYYIVEEEMGAWHISDYNRRDHLDALNPQSRS